MLNDYGRLDLSSRALKQLPQHDDQIAQCITTLDISKNKFRNLPRSVGAFAALEELMCSHNAIRSITPDIVLLTNMRVLDISFNELKILPNSICQLTSLTWLNVAYNQLLDLPADIGHSLKQLQYLDVNGNAMESVPPSLCALTSLQYLSLAQNRLLILPPEINRVPLRVLDVSRNQLTTLPSSMRNMNQLMELRVFDNPLLTPPLHLSKLGVAHLLAHMRANHRSQKSAQRINQSHALTSDQARLRHRHTRSDVQSNTVSLPRSMKARFERASSIPSKNDFILPSNSSSGGGHSNHHHHNNIADLSLPSNTPPQPRRFKELDLSHYRAKPNLMQNLFPLMPAYQQQDNTPSVPSPLIVRADSDSRSRRSQLPPPSSNSSHNHSGTTSVSKFSSSSTTSTLNSSHKTGSLSASGGVVGGSHSFSQRLQLLTQSTSPPPSSTTSSALPPPSPAAVSTPPSHLCVCVSEEHLQWNEPIHLPGGNGLIVDKADGGVPPPMRSPPPSPLGIVHTHSLSNASADEEDYIARLRMVLEDHMHMHLPEDLASALSDGIILCHFVRRVAPQLASSGVIHTPTVTRPVLDTIKCRRNLENFMEACRKIHMRSEDLIIIEDVLNRAPGCLYNVCLCVCAFVQQSPWRLSNSLSNNSAIVDGWRSGGGRKLESNI